MRYIVSLCLMLFVGLNPSLSFSAPSEIFHKCFSDNESWNERAACVNKWEAENTRKKNEELRAFLKENPRYRYPGQSLNKCFGKKRKVLISEVEHKANGDIIIRYPEYISPCYE